MTKNVKKPHGSPAYRHAWAALLALGLLGLGASAGCSSECSGPECDPCRDSDCKTSERCVQNECRPACSDDTDCSAPQVCRGYEFAPEDQGRYCVVLPGAGGGGAGTGGQGGVPLGRFTACAASSECDEASGFSCVEGECSYACRSHQDCSEVGHCEPRIVDGEKRAYCARDEPAPAPGTFYTACPNQDECAEGFVCIGSGVGDLDAYCTTDCETDDGCAPGFYCGNILRAPCEDACGFPGQPDDPECVPPAEIGAGRRYQCTELGVSRSLCRQREFCSSCETDADCLGVPNQVCAKDESGERICTRLCDVRLDSCPWGNAARCGVFDEELGLATCSHRFGACHAEGKTCEPCRTHEDCPGGVCASSGFTGERWCVSFETTCECPNGPDATGTCKDGGCPDSPSGLPVLCIGVEQSSLFNICYAANSAGGSLLAGSPQTGCWDSK